MHVGIETTSCIHKRIYIARIYLIANIKMQVSKILMLAVATIATAQSSRGSNNCVHAKSDLTINEYRMLQWTN